MENYWFEHYANKCYSRTKSETVTPSREYNFYMWVYDKSGNRLVKEIRKVTAEEE